jgi:hypothetical protein
MVLGQAIMAHCPVKALSKPGKSNSYLDAKNFRSALLEKITFDPSTLKRVAKNIVGFIAAVEKTPVLSTEFQRVVPAYANEAKDTCQSLSGKTVSEIDWFRGKIENRFDASMDRITGTLKKGIHDQLLLLLLLWLPGFSMRIVKPWQNIYTVIRRPVQKLHCKPVMQRRIQL